MADSSGIEKRREMRRRKILENSELRMNKLHGTIGRAESFEHIDRPVIDSEDLCPDPPDLSINEVITTSLQSFHTTPTSNSSALPGLESTQFGLFNETGSSGEQPSASDPVVPVPVWCERLERWRKHRVKLVAALAALVQMVVLVMPECVHIQNFLLPFVVMETGFYLAHIYSAPYSSNMGTVRIILLMLGVQQIDKLVLWLRYFSFLFSSWLDLNVYIFVTVMLRGLFVGHVSR